MDFQEIINHKKLTENELIKDLQNLYNYKAITNERKFCGNKFLYHFQIENLCKTRVKKLSLYEKLQDEHETQKLIEKANKLNRTGTLPNRIFEAERFDGSVVFFKPSTAKYIYKKYNATSVLDFTAGWGGRMLGASALNIKYTGIDTNISMKPAYEQMLRYLNPNLHMIWDSALNVDFSKLDYDFVLTSPPYINTEKYEHMPLFKSKIQFYTEFLVPLLTKSLTHIKPHGKVALNISPKMYQDLLKYFRPAEEEHDLLQQKRLGKDKQDKIYIWSPTPPI